MTDRHRLRLRRCGGRGAAALAVLAGATLLGPSAPTSASDGAFRGVAAAEGVRIGVTAVGAPVTNSVVDGASPIAQAAIDSTSGSSALASVAYPGDLVVTTPGLLAGVSGGQLSGVPPYPLLATAGSTTTPEQKVEGPGSTMRAAATARRAEATARSGAAPPSEGGPAPAWVTASFVEADDTGVVTSLAQSEVAGVTTGPLVLGRVVARSVVRRAPGAEPVRETSFEATGVSIGGRGVALTPAGLVVGGTTTPVSASPLQAVLDGAGVSVRPLAAETTADGVVSAGLVVSRTQDLPTAISPVTVSYTFGRALAAVSPAPLPDIGSGDVAAPVTDPTSAAATPGGRTGDTDGPGDAPLPATAPGPGAITPRLPTAGSGGPIAGIGGPAAGGAPATGSGAAEAAGSASEAASGRAPTAEVTVPIRQVGSRLFDLSTIYLLLVAAAATAGGVIQLVRRPGVR
jgi:hypothetical protein